jgi:rhodanese-related sulfurtransferase
MRQIHHCITTRYAVLSLSVILLCVTARAVPQDVWINELEFAPYIVMPEELLYRIIDGEHDCLVIDIRSKESYRNSHIRGAIHYHWDRSRGFSGSDGIPRDRDIMIVSRDGTESFDLLQYLLQRGYTNVWVVEGGMQNWPYGEYLEKAGKLP